MVVRMIVEQTYDPAAPIESVTEHPANPRDGDEDAIEASIDQHGFYGAVIVQASTGFIVAGNHRHRRMRARGETVIPVLSIDVDDDEALRILLNDNTTSDRGKYHDDTLLGLLDQLARSAKGLTGTGFEDQDLKRLMAQLSPPPLDDGASPRLDEGVERSCPFCSAHWIDTATGIRRLDQ